MRGGRQCRRRGAPRPERQREPRLTPRSRRLRAPRAATAARQPRARCSTPRPVAARPPPSAGRWRAQRSPEHRSPRFRGAGPPSYEARRPARRSAAQTTIPCSQGTPSSCCGILPGELAVSCGRSSRSAARRRAAPMQEISEQRTTALEAPGVPADAALAERWAGEPFLRQDEDPAEVLAPGTARRRALDEALAEIAAGREEPSYEWRTKFALMLGLERVLTGKPPVLESGTELRRHQVDALAGMLTALITANQRVLEEANGFDEPLPEGDDENGDLDGHLEDNGEVDGAGEERGARRRGSRRRPPLSLPPSHGLGEDDRRRRLRGGGPLGRRAHPHAPPAAREPVHPGADRGGLRRALDARDPQRRQRLRGRTRSRSRRTHGSLGTRTTCATTRTTS